MNSSRLHFWHLFRSGVLTSSLLAAPFSSADEAFWTGAAGNTWNAGLGNWNTSLGGGTNVATLPGSSTDVFFTAARPFALNLTNTLGADRIIKSLNFTIGSGAVTIGGSNTLTLDTSGGGIGLSVVRGVASRTVNAPLLLGGSQVWDNNGAFGVTTLTIGGTVDAVTPGGSLTISGQGNTLLNGIIGSNLTGGLIKAGTGTLTLGSNSNTFSGGLTIGGGVVAISNNGQLGNAANGVALGASGTLRFTAAVSLGAARVITVNGTALNPSGLDLSSGVTQILGAGQLAGSGAARVSSTLGTLSIEGANSSFTGSLQIGAPGQLIGSVYSPRIFANSNAITLRLQNGGTLSNVSGITVNNGAALNLTQSATAVTGRIGTAPLTFHSGRFQYLTSGNGGAAINETFGPVSVTGQLSIAGSTVAGPAAGTTLNFGTLTLNDHATLVFRAPQSGVQGTFGGAAAATAVRVFFSGMTPDTSTSGTTRSVIPWAGNANSVASPDVQNFMTYDANGFRPLNTTTEVVAPAANGLAAVGAGVNVRTSASQTIATGGQTINSYAESGSGTMSLAGSATASDPGNVLTIASGALATFIILNVSDAALNFPNGGYLHLGFPIAVNGKSRLMGSGGIVASSLGVSSSYELRLTNDPVGGNPFTGGLYANGNAAITFTLNNQLGNDGAGLAAGNLVLGGGQLVYLPSSASTVSLSDGASSRAIRVNESNGTIGVATMNATLQIPGTISGPGQIQFGGGTRSNATGTVELTNTAANTYSGGTLISTGTLRLSNANQLGTGSVLLNGGTLQAAANLNFTSAPTLLANSTINAQDGNVTLSGGLNGSGGSTGTGATALLLGKSGPGVLTIGGHSTYAGGINLPVFSGTLAISGNGQLPDLGPVTVGNSSVFNVDDSAAPLPNRVGSATNLSLTNSSFAGGATINLTTNAAGSSFSFGTLTVSGGISGGENTSTINLLDGGSGNHALNFLSLTTLAANNTLNLIGTTNLGRDTAGGSRIFFATPPTLVGFLIPGVSFTGFGGTAVAATYDTNLGVVAFVQSAGSFIDNIANVGPGSPTATDVNFLTNAATTANLGATIKSLAIAGHTVTLTPGVRAPQAGNLAAPANTIVLNNGYLASSSAPSTITAGASARLQFGLTGNTPAVIEASTDLLIAANIIPVTTGGLTKSGAATVTIAGTNQITGDYTINGGAVVLPASGTSAVSLSGSGNLDLGGGTLTLAGTSGAATTFAGNLTGAAGSTLILGAANTNTLTLTSSGNTFTGPVQVNGGTLVAANSSALGDSGNTVTVASGGTLGFSGGIFYSSSTSLNLSGAGAAGRSGAIDNISGSNFVFTPVVASGNTTIGATAGTLTLSGGVSSTSGALTFNPTGTSNLTLNTVGLDLGANALNKSGSGTLVLPIGQPNIFASINATGGLIRAFSDADFGVTPGGGPSPVTLNGGGLQLGAQFSFNPARTFTLGAAGGTLDISSFNTTLSNVLSGPGGFTKLGSALLTVASAQTYGGPTIIGAGNLQLAVANGLPASSVVTIGAAANGLATTLDLAGLNQTLAGLNIVAGDNIARVSIGAAVLTLAGDLTYLDGTAQPGNIFLGTITGGSISLAGAVRTFTIPAQNNATDLTISATITNGGIIFNGPNSTGPNLSTSVSTTLLNSVNTYTLGTTVARGVVAAGISGALPANGPVTLGTANSAFSGGVNLRGFDQTIGALALAVGNTGGESNVIGNTSATPVTLTIDSSTDAVFGGGVGGSIFVNATATAANNLSLIKQGTGKQTLAGANTYTGTTTISAGTLQLGNGGVTGSLLPSSVITNNASFVINRNNSVVQGTDFATGISGSGSLTQAGAGTTTLTGANAFTGATNITAGVLEAGAAGALGSTSSIAVSTGGTLRLSGSGDRVGDTVPLQMASGTFATGGLSETAGTFTLAGTATIDFGTGASVIHFADSHLLAWSGTLTITNWSGTFLGGGTDQLYFGLSVTGLTAAQLQRITFVNPPGFAPGNYPAVILSNGEVTVPEPSTTVLLGTALLGLLGLRGRRRAF